jgi:hypothetical protein
LQYKITEIKSLKLSKTHFYSVKFVDRASSEFRDFYDRMKLKDINFTELLEIIDWFKDWATYEGALENFFRQERDADRLYQPMEFTIKDDDRDDNNFGLRWYCYRHNDNIVILFNGNRKTNLDPELCPNVRPYFLEAVEISKSLDEAFNNGTLYIDNVFELKTRPNSFLKI